MKSKVEVLDVGDYVYVDDVAMYEKFRELQRENGYRLPLYPDNVGFRRTVLYWNGVCLMPNKFPQRNLVGLSEFIVRLKESYSSSERLVLRKGDCVNVRYPVEFELIRDVVKSYGYGFFETYRKFQGVLGCQYIEWVGRNVQGVRKKGDRVLSFSEFMSKLDNSFLMDRVVRWRTELNDEQRWSYIEAASPMSQILPLNNRHANWMSDPEYISDEYIITLYQILRDKGQIKW